MPTYTEITKPATPTYVEIGTYFNLLLINATDHLLISSNGRLAISNGAVGLYQDIAKPSIPTYNEITRPV